MTTKHQPVRSTNRVVVQAPSMNAMTGERALIENMNAENSERSDFHEMNYG